MRFPEHLRVISEAAKAFAEATTDYERLLDSVARTVSDRIGDSCAVFLTPTAPGPLRTVVVHATCPTAADQIRQMFERSPLDPSSDPMIGHVLASGEALVVGRIRDSPPAWAAAREGEAQERFGLHSYLIVALRAHNRSLGLLALGRFRPSSPGFDDNDRELAQNLADHASLAIENARLYAELQAARRAAVEAEERALESERWHRFLFEGSPIPKLICDPQSGRILAANDAALELYGYTAAEFLKLGIGELRAPDSGRNDGSAALEEAASLGAARHRRKDGNLLFVEERAYLIPYGGGREARFVVLQNQTERVEAETARRDSEGRLQRAFDMMMEGYTILGPDLRYLYVNDVGARHAQLPREVLIGRTPMELYPNFERTGMYGVLMRCLKDRTPIRTEDELTLADGKRACFEVNIRPTPDGGLVILSIDTTERRRIEEARETLEEQLRQAQRMEAVGRLAGGIAHDFNNILSIILGYGEALLDDLPASDPKRADVQEVYKAAGRAAELTKQLLMFSRQQMVEPKVLDLNEVIGGMQRMLRRILGEHIEITYRLDEKLGRIEADRGNIEQVIMNLVVNARDAMPEGGQLTIETACVLLDESFARAHLGVAPGPHVLLGVTDTGIGMEKATRLRVFEPFFTTKEQGKGTGLGLSTVFGIVQQSRGCVWVSSEPGRGSTFKVYLPRTDAAAESEPAVEAHGPQRGIETVLLVEDEEAVRLVAKRMLERNGYHVIVAGDPIEALELPDQVGEQIDVLMTDVVMPHMSGAALAARLLARWPGLRVLYVSGYTDGTVMAHGVRESGVSFLQKPFTSEQLARKLRSVLDAPVETARGLDPASVA